jgi:hypothetical protein
MNAVTRQECDAKHAEILEKLESIEQRLFKDNGTVSMQTRLARHEMVVRGLIWFVALVAGTAVTGGCAALLLVFRMTAKLGGDFW